MNFEVYEDAIVELLTMPGMDVKPLPLQSELNAARPSMKPQVYVIIHGSNFGERDRLEVVSQSETVQGEIFLMARTRRGEFGIYDVFERIAARLLGFEMPGALTPITFSQFGHVEGVQNTWTFALTFSFQTYRVQEENETADNEPLIRKITHIFQENENV